MLLSTLQLQSVCTQAYGYSNHSKHSTLQQGIAERKTENHRTL